MAEGLRSFPQDTSSGLMAHDRSAVYGSSPRANYTDRAIAACRRSYCQLLRIEGATWVA
jgi:hypothetical protein